jgi:glutamate synthase (NADPH/NADH) small chain
VRHVIELARAGKVDRAGAILFDNNPMSAITGAVCPNHLYCKGACVLGRKGKPVDFGKIEREISGKYLETAQIHCAARNGRRVLIVGSGPAGLGLSYYLAKAGFSVTVFEKEAKPGGMMRYGIPDLRLDKSLIDKTVTIIENMGVKFKTNTKVDLNNLPEGFDIKVIATGAWVSRKLGIPGEQYAIPGLEFLKSNTPSAHDCHPFVSKGSYIVIGGGNVAVDCALTAAASGATSVNVCYRKTESEMKAYPEEIALAKSKGVKFNFNTVPKEISKKSVLFTDNTLIHADNIIVAIGQTATENGLIPENLGENVYAIGDAVTGPSTIIQAVAQAKELARILLK